MTPEELQGDLGEIYHAARSKKLFDEGDSLDVRFVAAHFSLVDSQWAIASYMETDEFRDYRQGYLMKFGLLQAFQNQLKALEEIGSVVAIPVRADRLGAADVLATRHIVAGHPLGGRVEGRSWQHFHDRQTVHDPTVIRVMSFESSKPRNWMGQTIAVGDLVTSVDHVIRKGLTHIRDTLVRDAR